MGNWERERKGGKERGREKERERERGKARECMKRELT